MQNIKSELPLDFFLKLIAHLSSGHFRPLGLNFRSITEVSILTVYKGIHIMPAKYPLQKTEDRQERAVLP